MFGNWLYAFLQESPTVAVFFHDIIIFAMPGTVPELTEQLDYPGSRD